MVYYVFEVQQSKVTNTASLYGYNPTTAGAATASAATARASAFVTTATDLLSLSAPEKLWRALNPLGWPFVRVVVPAASIVVLPRAGHHMLPADIRKLSIPTSRLLLPRLKPLFYLFKVVILPQAVTATALYMLLRYLLKDTELLEAQRDRLGRSEIQTQPEEETEQPTGLPKITRSRIFTPDSGPQVQMLPGSHESDIDVIASSFDGQLLVSVGVDNTVCLWRFTNGHAAAGTRELLQAPEIHADDPVVTATISRDMRWVAAGSAAGLVQLWELLDDGPPSPQELQRLPEDRSARITSIAFDDRVVVPDDPFVDNPHPALKPANPPSILTARSDGAVLSVGIGPDLRTIIPPPGTHSRVFFLPAAGETKGDMRIISASQSVVTLYEKNGWMWSGLDISVDLAPNDRITCVCQSRIGSHDGPADLIALGHRFGLVEIFDTCGTVVAAIGQTPSVGAIRRVDLAGPHSSRCIGCGAANAEGFFVISSTASHVYVDRVLPHGAVFCRCATSRRTASKDSDTSKDSSPAKGSPSKASLVVPPAAGRARSSPHNSPKRSPSLLSPISNGEFPLSSHGSRRLSSMHRDGPDRPPSPRPSPLSAPNGSAGHSEHGWDMEVYPLGAVVLSGGSSGWGVVRDTLIGIRKAGGGIDDSPWQIWAIDLTVPWNGTILQAETANLSWLMRRSLVQPVGDSGVSMRDRRSGRLLSLNGRAPFPSIGESFSIPTHPSLGYVEVHPFVHRGPGSVVAGFGNRLGVISLPEKRAPLEPGQGSGSTWTLARRTAYTQTPPPPRRLSGVTDNTDGVRSANKAI